MYKMSIQFNKTEKKIVQKIIEEWYGKEGESLSYLRVTFEVCKFCKRHTMTETARLVKTILKHYKNHKKFTVKIGLRKQFGET